MNPSFFFKPLTLTKGWLDPDGYRRRVMYMHDVYVGWKTLKMTMYHGCQISNIGRQLGLKIL